MCSGVFPVLVRGQICPAGAALRHLVCCLCRRRPLAFRRVPVGALGMDLRGAGAPSVVCVAGVPLGVFP